MLCPGSGMLVMAIEAARQAAETRTQKVSGFFFQDAQFLAPIFANESSEKAAETVVELRPMTKSADEKVSTWYGVHIFSYADNKWKECFRTSLQTQYEESNTTESHGSGELRMEGQRISDLVQDAIKVCTQSIDSSTFYRCTSRHGFGYGPSFRLLRRIHWDGGKTSCGQIDISSAARFYEEADSPVHPALLDAAVQLLLTQASKGLSEEFSTLIPKRLAKAWISPKIWDRSTSSIRLGAVEHAGDNLVSGMDGSIYGLADDGSPLCLIEHLEMAEVSAGMGDTKNGSNPILLHKIAWQPCLSLLSAADLRRFYSGKYRSHDTTMKAFLPKLEAAMKAAAAKAVRSTTETNLAQAPAYMRKYVASMEHYCVQPSIPESRELSDSDLESLLRECEEEKPAWRAFPMVARALPSIIRGETDPLGLLFNTKAVERLYSHTFGRHEDIGLFKNFLNLASHETPSLRVLEVGAGTGAMSRLVIDALRCFEHDTGQTRFSQYFYTDISAVFFENARSVFSEVRERIRFQILDLDVDPLLQGFEPESYDIIVAGSVLHICADLTDALQRVRSLLKPGGMLISLEITKPEHAGVCATIGFGLIEGWWSSKEDWRKYSPLATEERWDGLLRQTGFSGVDIAFRDSEDEDDQLSSIMISRAVGQPNVPHNGETRQIILLIDRTSDLQCDLAEKIKERYEHAELLDLADLEENPANPSALMVSLVEVGKSFLASFSAASFDQLRTLLANTQDLLWVTSSLSSKSCDPRLGLARGFLRAMRSEYNQVHIVTLAFESGTCGCEDTFIARVLQACFESDPRSHELEFVVSNDILTIGRLEENRDLDAKRLTHTQPTIVQQAWGYGPPLAVEVGTPGMLDTLRFIEDPVSDLIAHEVEILAAVCPISFRDVFIALGRLGKEPLGLECAGTVTRVGKDSTDSFTPGERVLMISPGCMRSHPRALADSVFKIPDNLTFEDAVAGMNPGMTAYHALVNIARLQPHDKVLIHAAAGGTGQMAVAIAKHIGAEVFATVGTEEKRKLVTDPCGLGLPESHVFYSRNTSFKQGLMRVTRGYGVDVVLNSLSGDGLLASFDCLAPHGRFIDIGKSDIMANSSLPMAGFAKNITFATIDVYHIVTEDIKLTRHLVDKILAMISDGIINPPAPVHPYPVSKIEQALRYIQSGKNTGRIILTLGRDDAVPVSLQ